MEFITYTKQQAVELARDFIEQDFRLLCDSFLDPVRSARLFSNAPEHVRSEAGDSLDGYLLEDVVATFYEFVTTGRWVSGDIQEYVPIFNDFVHFDALPGLAASASTNPKQLLCLWNAFHSRMRIDPLPGDESPGSGLVGFDDIASVGGFALQTVRVATYAKGENQLKVVNRDKVERAEAVRWLTLKGRFKPSRYDYPHEYSPKQELSSARQFPYWLRSACERRNLAPEQLAARIFANLEHRAAFLNVLSYRADFIDFERPWFSNEIALSMGLALDIDPLWIAKSVLRIAHNEKLDRAVKILSEIDVQRPEAEERPEDISDSHPLDPIVAKKVLGSSPSVSRHPLQKKPNAKMDGYLHSGVGTITHQHDSKTQYIWIREIDFSPDLHCFVHDRYPASEVNKAGHYGRHSGLKKYPDLVDADLVRIHVTTVGELNKLLDLLH